jgi:hypothetical protein
MALASYSELQTAIATYAFRSGDGDFTAAIPIFIQLAESRINKKLRLRDMEATVTLTLDEDGTATLPADYLSYRDVRLADGRPLHAVDLTFGEDTRFRGAAAYFTISGDEIRTFPATDADLILSYYAKVPALSSENPSSWLLRKAPEAYLYGALLESAPFMMDDARMATWGTLFEQSLADLQTSDELAKYARAAVKTSGPTP